MNPEGGSVPPDRTVLGFRFFQGADGLGRIECGRHVGHCALAEVLEDSCWDRDSTIEFIRDIDAVLTGSHLRLEVGINDSTVTANAERFTSVWHLPTRWDRRSRRRRRPVDDVEHEGATAELREVVVGWFEWCDTYDLWWD